MKYWIYKNNTNNNKNNKKRATNTAARSTVARKKRDKLGLPAPFPAAAALVQAHG